jgi:Aldo/keto reductase family
MFLFYNRNHRIRFIAAWLLFVTLNFINCSIVESSFAISQHKQHQRSHLLPLFRCVDQQQSRQPLSALHQSPVQSLPCVPTLDAAGLLPPFMYFDTTVTNSTFLKSNDIVKPTCRIQISWDIDLPQQQHVSSLRAGEMIEVTKEDVCTMVSNIQRSLDHGLTTFQLKPYTSVANQLQYDIYRALIDTTPKAILDQQSQIIIPFRLVDVLEENTDSTTSAKQSISTKSVRSHLLTLLDRLGTDCIDNLQIQFPKSIVHDYDGRQQPVSTKNNHLTSVVQSNNQRVDDRYYFDLMYQLQELVQEGYIRSMSSKDLSSTMHQHLQNNQLHTLLNTNQMDANLCTVSPLFKTTPPTTGHNSRHPDSSCYIPQYFIASNPGRSISSRTAITASTFTNEIYVCVEALVSHLATQGTVELGSEYSTIVDHVQTASTKLHSGKRRGSF